MSRGVRVARALLALALCATQLRSCAAPPPAPRLRLAQSDDAALPPSAELVSVPSGGVQSAALGGGLRCLDPAYPEPVLVAFDTAPVSGFDYTCRFVPLKLLQARDDADAAAAAAATADAAASTPATQAVRAARLACCLVTARASVT